MKKQFTTLLILLTIAVGILFAMPQSYGETERQIYDRLFVELVQNEPDVNVKANLKSAEIAKRFNTVPRQIVSFSGIDVDIEIIDVKAIKNGIEVLAKAWDTKGKSIGFGKDGSVEIERFRIFNPPICVDDINGTIVREYTDINTKEVKQRRLRVDPKQAILETIAHNVKVVGKRNTTVVRNRIGNTTSTFFPSAGAAEPADGYTTRAGVDESWATIRAGAGTAASATTIAMYAYFQASATTNNYTQIQKGIVCFLTSAIGSDNIDSATFSIYGQNKFAPTNNVTIDVYASTPASTSNVVAADYGQIGSTSLSDAPITYAAFSLVAYNDFALNATGIANIDKAGVSKFGIREAAFEAINNLPTWASSALEGFYVLTADNAGTSNDPKLVVVHTAAASTFIPQVIWW